MKIAIALAILLAAPLGAAAQDFEIDTNTPEGQLLQQIGQEEDDQQKISLLNQFTQDHPRHEAIAWVWGQLPALYEKIGDPDKALAACDKMPAADPNHAAGAHGCLKTAEAKQDPNLTKDWAFKTHAAAKKVTEAPKPEFEYEDEEAAWKETVDFAAQVSQYSEYAIYAAALKATDAPTKVALRDALAELNPDNQYLAQLYPQLFYAYLQAGDTANAVTIAEEVLKTEETNEDMLFVMANHHLGTTKDQAKAVEYAQKLVALMETKAAPEGVAPDAWEQKKTQLLGQGLWITGVIESTQGKLLQADKTLRKALPYLKGNAQMTAEALFHLGVANFKLGDRAGNQQRILDAFNFTKRCAAMSSRFQAQAKKNLTAIQGQYRIK